MGMRKLSHGGKRRLVRVHVIEQTLHQQHVVDGAQTLRAFGMLWAHFVTGAIGMGDVSRQQFGLQSRFHDFSQNRPPV